MSETVKLKSKDGQTTIECNERVANALLASGRYVRVIEGIPVAVSTSSNPATKES